MSLNWRIDGKLYSGSNRKGYKSQSTANSARNRLRKKGALAETLKMGGVWVVVVRWEK